MSMNSFNKELWSSLISFRSQDFYPVLPCPYCNAFSLALDKGSLVFRDQNWFTHSKVIHRDMEAKQRELTSIYEESKFLGVIAGLGIFQDMLNAKPAKFVGFFVCDRCGKDVAIAGTAKCPSGRGADEKSPMLKVEYFSPPVPMFDIHPATPKAVVEELLQAFSHFHSDLTASGAKIRRAMERICESLGYKQKTLHACIKAMGQDYPKEAGWLSVLKLVGNEAAHSDGIDEADLLASFQVLAAVLDIFRRKAMDADIDRMLPAIEQKFNQSETPK